MAPFIRRSTRGVGPFLEWRVGLFAVGATLALGGMYLNERWLVGVAIVVLAGAMALRFVAGHGEGDEEQPGEEPAGGRGAAETEGPGSDDGDEDPA